MSRYAAIGNDGTNPICYGMGATEDAAEAEALREGQKAAKELVYRVLTDEEAAQVEGGDVTTPIASALKREPLRKWELSKLDAD